VTLALACMYENFPGLSIKSRKSPHVPP
jgi:hypothetical protein